MVYFLNNAPVNGGYGDSQELDGDISKIECVDMSQDGGTTLRSGYTAVQAGRPIKPDFVPTKIEWRSKSKIPDYKTPMGIPTVCDRFREIVEQFEPGVHQWFPVEFVDRKGGHLAHRWYFIPCNRIDSVDHANTTMILYRGTIWSDPREIAETDPEYLPTDFSFPVKLKRPFSAVQTQNYHAWRDKHIGHNHLLISNALAEALAKENFSGIDLKQAETI
jgi:hypothetical protein